MERRYGRANERYRSKINSRQKKPSFKIGLGAQSVLCAILLAAGIITSLADFNVSKKITYVLYHTNSLSEWKKTFIPAARAVRKGSVKAVTAWNEAISVCEKRLGLSEKSKDNAPVNAKAQKQTEDKSKKSENKAESADNENSENEATDNKPLTFRAPIKGRISSTFGERVHPIAGNLSVHTGVDIAASHGDTVVSAAPGVVTSTDTDDANGSYVEIKHNDEFTTVYAHLSKISVSKGEKVDYNTKIGEVGSSGISTGPHLHFEIKKNSESVNPEDYISLR